MTTIAYRNGILAGDTMVSDRGCYVGAAVKVFRRDDGAMLGTAGCFGDMTLWRDWFLAGGEGDPPAPKHDDSEGLLISASGVVEWLGTGGRRIEVDREYHAIGSGFRIAMGALAAGASAERAIEICCDIDDSTRRPITVLAVA